MACMLIVATMSLDGVAVPMMRMPLMVTGVQFLLMIVHIPKLRNHRHCACIHYLFKSCIQSIPRR